MLLDLLFPVVGAEVLRALFHYATRDVRARIARWSELALRSVQRELSTLSRIGLMTCRTNEYDVFYSANRNHVIFAPLQQLVFKERALFVEQEKTEKRPRQSSRESRRRKRYFPVTPVISQRNLTWQNVYRVRAQPA